MEIAIGIGVLLAMALAAAAARSMWLALRRHVQEAISRQGQETAALRAAIGELTSKLTTAANHAHSSNEDIKRLAERAGEEIAALRVLIVGLDSKYTAPVGRINGLADNVNAETKRLIAEHDHVLNERDRVLNEKVAALIERITGLKEHFNVKFEELAKRLTATKLVVTPQRGPSILPSWKKTMLAGVALAAMLCGFAFGDDLGDATLRPAVLEEQIQSLSRQLERVKIDFERRLDQLDSVKTGLARRLDRLESAKSVGEWRLNRIETQTAGRPLCACYGSPR